MNNIKTIILLLLFSNLLFAQEIKEDFSAELVILNDENLNNLSSQEQMIYENIQNGIYQILEN